MPKQFNDHSGEYFGLLKTIEYEGGGQWKVQCVGCGSVRTVSGHNLRKGYSRSCGKGDCFREAKALSNEEIEAKYKHGGRRVTRVRVDDYHSGTGIPNRSLKRYAL